MALVIVLAISTIDADDGGNGIMWDYNFSLPLFPLSPGMAFIVLGFLLFSNAQDLGKVLGDTSTDTPWGTAFAVIAVVVRSGCR